MLSASSRCRWVSGIPVVSSAGTGARDGSRADQRARCLISFRPSMLPELECLDRVIPIARAAGAIVMQVYATAFEVAAKHDASPVTEADTRAEALIETELARLAPDVPIVSEEAVGAGRVPTFAERFWLVDPLDGTREFIARNGEFTVNVALVEHGRAVLGVVFAPALGR